MLRFGCRMIALRSSQRVSNPISFVRIGRRFYDKYEPEVNIDILIYYEIHEGRIN